MISSDREVFNSQLINTQPFELISNSINKQVTILSRYGYEYTGILKGIDNTVNCILEDATETNSLSENPIIRKHQQILVSGNNVQIIIPDQPPL